MSETSHSETSHSETWHAVAARADLSAEQPLAVKIGAIEIGLFELDGAIHAIEDVCPHAYALLSQGFVDGDSVECALHGARFHIPSGRCTAEPGGRDLKTYKTRIVGDRIHVAVDG